MDNVVHLHPEGKTLVVARTDDGFTVTMRPAVTPHERSIRMTFPTVDKARAYAWNTQRMISSLFRTVVDETGGAG